MNMKFVVLLIYKNIEFWIKISFQQVCFQWSFSEINIFKKQKCLEKMLPMWDSNPRPLHQRSSALKSAPTERRAPHQRNISRNLLLKAFMPCGIFNVMINCIKVSSANRNYGFSPHVKLLSSAIISTLKTKN